MKKIVSFAGIAAVVVFGGMQLYRPEKNQSAVTGEHLYRRANVPANVRSVLNKACMDCHSDQTRYRWYHEVAPVSWVVSGHIDEGKKELNFSRWGSLDAADQIGRLDEMKKEISSGDMPLSSYSLIHREARLKPEQRDSLVNWITQFQDEIISRME